MLHYETDGSIATITIDNPPVNSLTPEMHKRLFEILNEFNEDKDILCGILTSPPGTSFCAGADIKTPRPERSYLETVERHLAPSAVYPDASYPGWEREVMNLIRYKPIVAAIRGFCLGHGFMYMSLLSDIRYAAKGTIFGLPEIAYGMGGAGGMISLGRHIPHVAAMELLLLGEKVSAEEAKRMFLINDVTEEDALMDRAMAAAEKIASHPSIGVRTEMEAYQRSMDLSRSDARAMTEHMYRLTRSVLNTQPPLSKDSK
jgi:enoyl-CoA hydratase/carnithine racemase